MPSYYYEGDTFFNPTLKLSNPTTQSAVEAFLKPLRFTVEQAEQIRADLRQELVLGLQATPARPSIFPMFNTFATSFPTGSEVGDYLALDIGGTNLRLMHLKLQKTETGKYEQSIDVASYETSSEVRKSDSKTFFGFLASSVGDFISKRGLGSSTKPVPLGFTFSFGYDQLAIDRGCIVSFGIETNIVDAIGRDPVELLQTALDAQQVPVRVVVLANDVTATLIYAKYLQQETTVSLILGSGTNVGYIEAVENFGRITNAVETFGKPADKVIINTELGFFGDKGQMDKYMTKYELAVDANSYMPRVYVYEKLAGAAFMGEHFRYILYDLAKHGHLLSGKITEQLKLSGDSKAGLSAVDISQIEAEFLENGNANKYTRELLTRFGYSDSEISDDDCAIVTFAAQLVTLRVATFASAETSIFVDHLAHLPVVKVGVDGSLYRKHPKMARLMDGLISAMCPTAKAELFSAEDGSSIGVALLAAVVCNGGK